MSVPNGHTYLCRRKAAKVRFDNRQKRPAYQPLPSHSVSGSGASGTSDPPNRQCYPPHFMREYTPPNLHDPQRAKGSLDRRSKRLSFPHFFLRRKKCGRRRPPPRQGKANSPPGQRPPPQAQKKRRPSPSLFVSHQLSVRFRHSSSCSSSNFSFLFSSTSVS